MDIQQVVTPVSSHGTMGHRPVAQAGATINKTNQLDHRPVLKQHGVTRPTIQMPLFSQLDRRFQIKLLDLCTEYQGVYYESERLDSFWDVIADALNRNTRFPLSGKNVETWVEGICREAKGYLIRGEEFPRRADREDLDIAIEDWLEVEGRKRLQKGASEMRMGYILAFGPEKSEEEHLLSETCLHELRENADKIKTAVSEKGKASRKTSILLVRKIEALTPKTIQKPLTAEYFSDGNGRSEKLLSMANPRSNNDTICHPDHTHLDNTSTGPSDVGEAAAPEPLSISSPKVADVPNDSPPLFARSSPVRDPSPIFGGLDRPCLSARSSPTRGLSPTLGAFDSPIKGPSRATRSKTTERRAQSHSSLVSECTRSKTRASMQRADPNKQKSEIAAQKHADTCSVPPAIEKRTLRRSARKSKTPPAGTGTNSDLPHEPGRTDSSEANSRKTSASPSSRNTATVSPNSNTQDQEQAEGSGRLTDSPDRVGEEQDRYLTAATPQKGRNKRSKSQNSTPNKVHRTQYGMSSPLSISQDLPEDVAGYDDVEDQAPNTMSVSDHLQEPQPPPTEGSGGELGNRGSKPGENSSGMIPIIDLTQSPDPVKKEEEQDGSVFGSFGGRLISQLTTNLHGATGLTEHIKEIVGRTISQSLGEFEHRTLGRFDEMRNDLRALEDRRNRS
ncbi:hypothetical protein F4818DRAFT_85860 [Hypoxylon cercidicola]|nr:hypothetical protein F4818DRAFT_85860 [Hypoxylon cercidicola]